MSNQPTPVRIQRSRKRGSKLESPNGLPIVCVSRPGLFGNPWSVKEAVESGIFTSDPKKRHHVAQMCVDEYRRWLVDPIWTSEKHQRLRERREDVLRRLPELRGKNLACWCKPGAPCHADVLLEIANSAPSVGIAETGGGK